jgi:hypothetical protein
MKVKCGDANPNGNISLFYKGGCKKELDKENAYRCVGCGGWFHYKCILKHFELEEGHDNAKNAIGKLIKYILKQGLKGHSLNKQYLLRLCDKGLAPNKLLLKKYNEKK